MPFCSQCGKQADASWNYCPMDATPLPKVSNTYSNGTAKIHNPYTSNNSIHNVNNQTVPVQNPYLVNNNPPLNPYVNNDTAASVNVQQFMVRPCKRCEAQGRLIFGDTCKVCKLYLRQNSINIVACNFI